MKQSRLRAHAAMLVTALIWGISFVLVKLALREVHAVPITLLRYLITSVGFCLVMLVGRRNLPSIRRCDWIPILGAAATGVVGYGMLINIGLQNSASSIASLINTIGPVFTLILSYLVLGEKLTRNKMLGIGIALCGVILIVILGTGDTDLTVASMVGPLVVASAVFSWALYSIFAKPLIPQYQTIPFTALIMILGTVLMAPAAAAVDWSELAMASPIVWIGIAFTAIGSTLIGQFLWNYALGILDASEVSIYLYLVPVTTVITAILTIGEIVTIYFVLGGAMIIIGLALTSRTRSSAQPTDGAIDERASISLEPF